MHVMEQHAAEESQVADRPRARSIAHSMQQVGGSSAYHHPQATAIPSHLPQPRPSSALLQQKGESASSIGPRTSSTIAFDPANCPAAMQAAEWAGRFIHPSIGKAPAGTTPHHTTPAERPVWMNHIMHDAP